MKGCSVGGRHSVALCWIAELLPGLLSFQRPREVSFLPFEMSLSSQFGA